MKVLHAYNQHRGGGGAENAIPATIEMSRRYGIEVEVFTRNSEDLPRNLSGRLQAAVGAFYAPRSVKAFTSLLDSFQPDLVHIHEVFPLVSPWILPVCGNRNIPVVMTCIDYRLTCPIVTHLRDGQICTRCTDHGEHWAVLKNCRESLPESLTVALYNALTRRKQVFHRNVTHFIAPSAFTRDWLIEHAGIAPEKITAISPLVRIPESSTDAAQGAYVAYAGRFTPEKGVQTFFAASRLSSAPFRLARHARSLITVPVPPETKVIVNHDRSGLEEFYRGARLLVFPSIWFETFGLVPAEAMSYGLPVIASRIGAVTELIEDGVDGLLFEPGNERDLAEKVDLLWNNPELCRRMGRAGRQKAARLWSLERHIESHFALYERVCLRQPVTL